MDDKTLDEHIKGLYAWLLDFPIEERTTAINELISDIEKRRK